MKIMHYKQILPPNFVHRDQIIDSLLKGAKRLVMLQIADMLADEGLAADDEGDAVFQVGAHREDGAVGRQGCNRAWSIAASPAQNRRTESSDAGHRVVHTPRDWALAYEKRVRDFCQPL